MVKSPYGFKLVAMIVYLIKNKANGKVYVGRSTSTSDRRWKQHLRDAAKPAPVGLIDKAIKKHGPESFSYRVLERVDRDEGDHALNLREVFWIQNFRSTERKRGYNLSIGGGGATGIVRGRSFRLLQQNRADSPVGQYSLDGKFLRSFDSIPAAARALKTDDGNIRKACTGERNAAAGFRWKKGGKSASAGILKRLPTQGSWNRKKVFCFSKNGKLIATYDSGVAASRATSICRKLISMNINGRCNSAGGFVWSNSCEFPVIRGTFKRARQTTGKRAIVAYLESGERLARFDSIMDAVRALKARAPAIVSCLKGRYPYVRVKRHGALRFAYVEAARTKLQSLPSNLRSATLPTASYDAEGNLVKMYSAIHKAAEEIGMDYKSISGAARNETMCGGHRWRIGSASKRPPKRIKTIKLKPLVCQYSMAGLLIQTHPSYSSAGRAVKTSPHIISLAARGLTFSCAGFVWRTFPEEQIPNRIRKPQPLGSSKESPKVRVAGDQ